VSACCRSTHYPAAAARADAEVSRPAWVTLLDLARMEGACSRKELLIVQGSRRQEPASLNVWHMLLERQTPLI